MTRLLRKYKIPSGIVLLSLCSLQAQNTDQSAIQAASEKDRQRVMDELHISSIRPGADGDPSSPRAANYDEAKAGAYTLPDPLMLNNGKKVTTAKEWWTERRPQIAEDFDREVYGRFPAHIPGVKWEVVSTTHEKNGDYSVIAKKLLGHVDNAAYPAIKVDIEATLETPENAKGPVPVMIELDLDPVTLAALMKRLGRSMPAPSPGPTWQQQLLAKGWGYVSYIPVTVQADNGAGLTTGIIGLVNKGQPRKLDDWGVLKAWGWGASRVLDYLETDPAVNAKQVGITGHSRYGKASLVAMADDQRFAIGYISSSGMGGAALYRRDFGELLSNVAAANEYHWMAGYFLKYAGPLEAKDVPVDSHELIALCAPRPVFIGGGAIQGDGWIDPHGSFLAAVAAGPVYKLLGKKPLQSDTFPPMGTALLDGDIAFRQHSEGHTPAPNWPYFITFASRYFTTQ